MERIEKLIDDVLAAYEDRRVRLWHANFADIADEFGPWKGMIRVVAESYPTEWQPDRDDLRQRLQRRYGNQDIELTFNLVAEEILPLAREAIGKDLLSKQVPADIAERAKTVFSLTPPRQQWKM